MMREIYADHAATTFPRPPEVVESMVHYLREIGCSPGRGAYHQSLAAARMVYESRCLLARFFAVPEPEQIIFTPNVTTSLNLAFKGLLAEGDHVLISSMEHNAVVRPLSSLARDGHILLEQLSCGPDGKLDLLELRRALRPNTRLVVLTHASNVTGTLLPVYDAGEMLAGTNTFFCVDAAQTAGTEVVDFTEMRCDYLAFTGHKGLLGPPGIGGLCFSQRAAAATKPLIEGGTGSRSEDEYQPNFLPDKFESGTQNLPGIAGLAAGVRIISEAGLTAIRKEKTKLMETLLFGLSGISGVTIYGTKNAAESVSAVSIKMSGVDSGDLSFMLDQAYGIQTRSGLHCAPLAHKTIGTFPEGTVRFSLGYQNTAEDVDAIIAALREISVF